MALFSRKSRHQVGIDIGTSSIKVVELAREGSHARLENYGIMSGLDFFGKGDSAPDVRSTLRLSESDIASALRKLLELTKVKTKEAVFAIPTYSSFLTVMELPQMQMEELEKAVSFEARNYIPVPLSEVVVDWLALPPRTSSPAPQPQSQPQSPPPSSFPGGGAPPGMEKKKYKPPEPPPKVSENIPILIIAVPREVISKYQRIAQEARLTPKALESESFSIIRALVGNDLSPLMLIDVGARSTTLTVIDQGFIQMNHNLDLSGKEITLAISRGLNVSLDRADELKKTVGLGRDHKKDENAQGITELITPLVNRLVLEIQKMTDLYSQKGGPKVQKIILSGGTARLPGFIGYIKEKVGIETVKGNPFARIRYPEKLKPILEEELASALTVACGVALRDLD